MTLTLNGETREFGGDTLALASLLQQLDLAGRPVVVEHNREPVLPGRLPRPHPPRVDRLRIFESEFVGTH